jgi:hypothetical protein
VARRLGTVEFTDIGQAQEGMADMYDRIGVTMGTAVLMLTALTANAEPQSATVPITLDHNRLTIAVELQRADGSLRTARAWVDSGGDGVVMAEALARDLGVDLSGVPASGVHSVATTTPVPAMSLGGVVLDTEGMTVSVMPGRFARPGVAADCVLPARCLRRLHVVFDYPARRLTVARSGVLTPRGARIPCRVNPETGLFMIDAVIDGEKVSLGLDTGSAGTWVGNRLTSAWLARHPGWPQAVGAAGSANFFGFALETQGVLLQLPALSIGSILVKDVAVLGLDPSLFDWYSKKSAGVVAGFVGADVLARFRVEVDLPGQMTWWEPGPPRAVRDLDIVGLTVRAEGDGSFTVAGVVMRNGQPAVAGVQTGDRLLRVDALEVTNAPMGSVIDALRGKPGETRTLVLDRAGARITVEATVVRLP